MQSSKQNNWLAGVDEAGRGPLAGPVIAAAVILNPDQPIEGLADSKKLSEKRREALFDEIQVKALAWAIGRAEVAEIDEINILQASLLAMQRAVQGLTVVPDYVQVDGNRCPSLVQPVEAIVKGDTKVAEISAASILAKVARDREMQELHIDYPQYRFDKHKGYPTQLHRELLMQHGICKHHRRSYAPVKSVLAKFSAAASTLESA